MNNIVGRCSLCGGNVVQKNITNNNKNSIIEVVCESCGAKKKQTNQIVEMQHEDTRILLTE